jgi:hypothetical protein
VFALFFLNPGEFIKPGNLARDLNRDVRRIETRDPANPASARECCLRERISANSIRTYHSHACDYATFLHLFPVILTQ